LEFIEMFHLGLPPQIDFCAFPRYTCLVGVGVDYRQQKSPCDFSQGLCNLSLFETSRTIQILIKSMSNRVKVDSVDKVKSFLWRQI